MKNTRKLTALLLAVLLLFSLTACGGGTTKDDDTTEPDTSSQLGGESDVKGEDSDDSTSDDDSSDDENTNPGNAVQSDEKLGDFSRDATLDETVLVDENGVKITATGLTYGNYYVELELTIENSSGGDLDISSEAVSVNGYMFSGYLWCDVADGKKANDSISFEYDEMLLYGITEIADIEIDFDIEDANYDHTYSGPRQLKTSAYDSYDYSKDTYQEVIASQAAMNTYGYTVTQFSTDKLYEKNGVTLLSSCLIINSSGSTGLFLEMENTTDSAVNIATSDIAINGLVVSSVYSTWSRDTINAGKRAVIDIDLTSVMDAACWDACSIGTAGSVSLSLTQENQEYDEITDAIPVEITVPGANPQFDASGTEVYNRDGLRIVYKAVVEDDSEYSDDLYLLLIAENNSGKTLTISDTYNSFSVNDYMLSASCYTMELANGESALIKFDMWDNYLEDISVESIDDISTIDATLEIEASGQEIGEAEIHIER